MLVSNIESFVFRVIKDWNDFATLKEDWQKLLVQSDADNLFLTWEWINCWRITQGKLIKPLIIVIQDSQGIFAIAPFYIQEYRLANLLTYQALRFVGDKGSGSEYSNFIVKKENSIALKSRLWEYLLSPEVKPCWDFIWFTNVKAWAEGGQTLLQSLASVKGLNCNHRNVEFAPTPLNDFSTDFLPKLSKSLRTNIRQTTRRLDKLGSWEMLTCKDDDEISELLEQLFSLHNKHWLHSGLGTFERRPELADFYRLFVPLALKKGWLRLLRLESHGEIQAMQLGYVYNNEFLAIQEGFNPEFIPGIGQVLRYYSFTHCQKEGLSCYDFLGVYTDHKRRWLAEKKIGANLFIWQTKIKNIPFTVKKIWPTGRYLTAL
ncbi:MAG: CelD/BcsL family acetyltransferase involved in cellulose biosynthesis [Psychromonas sp.]|jgi:CelD/BcsL family acetyltransferase involved in cellulose biosynthesis|uniref:GNAT family N-acetyltransferase n=1 Tax=Psychromonas sp. TaxID=1884585 RepID=UPI0039E6B9C6